MNTASLELCKELYELTGWRGTEHIEIAENNRDTDDLPDEQSIPLYDLGYLFHRLPEGAYVRKNKQNPGKVRGVHKGKYTAAAGYGLPTNYIEFGDTPENAAIKLLCEMIRVGTLIP